MSQYVYVSQCVCASQYTKNAEQYYTLSEFISRVICKNLPIDILRVFVRGLIKHSLHSLTTLNHYTHACTYVGNADPDDIISQNQD